ncbi:MAG TPA: glycoside hydrolase family 2 TIM barrel-domain containing protein [Acidisarcina sp.]
MSEIELLNIDPKHLHPYYPRPQLQREHWIPLNGIWDFAIDAAALLSELSEVQWTSSILVPFSPETAASGIDDTGFYSAVWYRRSFDRPELKPGERLLLHFGAVDHCASVWVNGTMVASHEGGYTPFSADITSALIDGSPQQIAVRAYDDPADLSKPRGKQDWKLEPHSIWYPRTTGIWQTVWMEVVPACFIESLRWTSNLERWEIGLEAGVAGAAARELRLTVRMHVNEQVLASDTYSVIAGEVHRSIALSDPGIDDYRNALLWSPSSPTIIDVEMELRNPDGELIDQVRSYTALRAIAVQGDRFILNGRPLSLRLVLDQGYWPGTGMTAPNDDALLQDVVLAKKLGFNGVRKHQKIEDPRYLYWADHLGLLVWEEMPSAYRYTRKSVERLTREWMDVLHRDSSHPCIVTWVPFNESWGVPDLPESPAQRNYVQALYHLTKAFDPTRPVIGNDGWESVATDIIGIHDYDDKPERIGKRYGLSDIESRLFKRERPGGRMLLVDGGTGVGQPIVLTEFGGIAFGDAKDDVWGYSRSETAEDLLERYSALLNTVRSLPALAGFCYTQFADTYQEANGLLFADRTPKASLEALALATNGSRPDYDAQAEALWRDRLMERQAPYPVLPNRPSAKG